MKGEQTSNRRHASPTLSKTAREWILSSALYDGIEDEDIRQVEMLLSERGANPNTLLPEFGIAPFHMVVANESTKFAVQATDICLQHGADPNVRSEDGLTPVHLAAMWGCPEVLHVLLASGGNPWLVDCFNKNAFDYALSENQDKCYNVLKMSCNSQAKPSGHSKSPYHLNLKRVVLYKNDLQIVYEASPSSHRCVSTQTSPTSISDKTMKNFSTNTALHTDKVEPVKNNKSCIVVNEKNMLSFQGQNTVKATESDFEAVITTNSSKLSSRLKEVIVNHRKNSTTFEYSPSGREEECRTNKITSWKGTSEVGGITSNIATELIEKLEKANQIRQSLKPKETQNENFKNITQRKNLQQVPKSVSGSDLKNGMSQTKKNVPFLSSQNGLNNDTEEMSSKNNIHLPPQNKLIDNEEMSSKNYSSQNSSLPQKQIGFELNMPDLKNLTLNDSKSTNFFSQCSSHQNEIGFVLNDSLDNSTITSRRNQTNSVSNPESPPSIGFILDNLDESEPQTRGSSLFSDINSDIEICNPPGQDIINDGMIVTEDESTAESQQKIETKHSFSDLLDPCVTCLSGDTREWSSKECFESCMEELTRAQETSLKVEEEEFQSNRSYQTISGTSPTKDSTFLKDSLMTTIHDEDCSKRTPVNPRLVSSTPEKLLNAGSTAAGPEKRAWVEATISSSTSSDEDHYMSVSEEYEYTDLDEGVVLIERRYLNNDIKVFNKRKGKGKVPITSSGSEMSEVSTISGSERAYDTDELRRELQDYGFPPGPINGNTKRVYLRQLKRCRRKPDLPPQTWQPGER